MTITLEWWQIVALIPLILIAIVISSRLVTLIGMVAIQHWSKQTQNPIFADEQSLRLNALNESPKDRRKTYWDRGEQNVLRYGDTDEAVQLGRVARDAEAGRAPTSEEWRDLLGRSLVEYVEPDKFERTRSEIGPDWNADDGLVRLPTWRDEKGRLQTPYGTVYEDAQGRNSTLGNLGSTGSSPIGTSYDTEGAKFVPEKPIKPKRNKGTWLRPRLFKGKHPHV